jgi:membrane-bound lytic murein transglycosylase D
MLPAAYAQTEEPEEEEFSVLSSDTSYAEIGMMPEVLDENVNNLLQSWHAQYFAKKENYCLDNDENVIYSDDIYRDRLEKLPCIIPMTYNQHVRKCIDVYASKRRNLVRYLMGMADVYFPVFEQILDEYDLPLELKYLAVVESALNPRALSRVGASGLWQFMLPTGRIYGLEINSLVDERLDPEKATRAACKYFKDMYDVYGNWHLVLASYNCGPGNVNKAIRRAGGKTDYWDIFPYLPRETRSYVPLFIAVTYIMNYYCEHNLCPIRTDLSIATDTFVINDMIHLQQIAEVLNLDIELLRIFNPQYKREIVPGNFVPSVVKLPLVATNGFIDNEKTIYRHRVEELLANSKPVKPTDRQTSAEANRETIHHIVEAGENLYVIANRYGVTAQNIRAWNKLKSNKVPKGKRLTIHIDNGGITYAANPVTSNAYAKEDKTSDHATETKPATVEKPKAKQTLAATQKPKPANNGQPATAATGEGQKMISYTVKSGDSLYSISKKYPGMTVDKIQSANQMKDSRLKVGQVLKIPIG